MFESTHTWVDFYWHLRGSPIAMSGPLGDRLLRLADAEDAETVETLIYMDLAFEAAQSERAERERNKPRR